MTVKVFKFLLLYTCKPKHLVLSCDLTSVTASREAECLSSRSIDRMWFFLQAICRGVKPFW